MYLKNFAEPINRRWGDPFISTLWLELILIWREQVYFLRHRHGKLAKCQLRGMREMHIQHEDLLQIFYFTFDG